MRLVPVLLSVGVIPGCTCRSEPPPAPVIAPAPAPVEAEGKREGRREHGGGRAPVDAPGVWERRQVVHRLPLVHLDPAVARTKLQAVFAEELGADSFGHKECTEIQVYETGAGDLKKGGKALRRIVRHADAACTSSDDDRVADVIQVAAADEAAAMASLEQLFTARTSPRAFKITAEAHPTATGERYALLAMESAGDEVAPFPPSLTATDGALLAWALPAGEASVRCLAPLRKNAWIGGAGREDEAEEPGEEPGDEATGGKRRKGDRAAAAFRRVELVSWSAGAGAPVATEVVITVPARATKGGDPVEAVRTRLAEAGLLATTPPVDIEAWIEGCGS